MEFILVKHTSCRVFFAPWYQSHLCDRCLSAENTEKSVMYILVIYRSTHPKMFTQVGFSDLNFYSHLSNCRNFHSKVLQFCIFSFTLIQETINHHLQQCACFCSQNKITVELELFFFSGVLIRQTHRVFLCPQTTELSMCKVSFTKKD